MAPDARNYQGNSARLTASEYQRVLSSSMYSVNLSLKGDEDGFYARFESRRFGELQLIKASANQPLSLRRRPNRTTPQDEVLLKYQSAGRALHKHEGASILTGCNSLMILRPDQEEGAEQIDPAACIILRMPRDLVESRMSIDRLDGCSVLNCPAAIKDIFRDILDAMWLRHAGMNSNEQRLMSTILLDLVVASLVTDSPAEKTSTTLQAKIARIKSAIRNNLSDPELSLEKLSHEIGMSRSALCATAKEAGTTVGRIIMDMRLQRVRDALLDPGMDGETVSSIIYSFGFEDISHCIRRFREKYGHTPANYRRQRDHLP